MDNTSKIKSNSSLIVACIFSALAFFASLIITWFFFVRVVPREHERTIELGAYYELSDDPGEYLTGLKIFRSGAVVDTHDVNIFVPGEYTVKVFYKGKTIEYPVSVADTKAPTVEFRSDHTDDIIFYDGLDEDGYGVFEIGIARTIGDMFDYIYDESGELEAFLYCDGEELSSAKIYPGDSFKGESVEEQLRRIEDSCVKREGRFVLDELKYYNLTIEVRDGSGNTISKDFTVKAVDTIAPNIIAHSVPENHFVAANQPYSADEIALYISDNSNFYTAAFIVGDETVSKITFDKTGPQKVTIVASDESGNEATCDVTVMVDEAPIFIAVADKDIKVGSDYDLLDHIVAVDNTDGNVTDTIVVDDGGFDPYTPGLYSVKYTATDSHNLSTTVICNLNVGDEGYGDYYLSEKEISLLCDYDFFEYEPLSKNDYEAACELVEPTLVNLIHRTGGGGYSAGSGFIYRIDEDYTYIVTCVHVIEDLEDPIELMFCDSKATVIKIDVPFYLEKSDINEIAMLRIDTGLIPAETLVELREIYCDEDIYRELKIGQNIIAYSGHWINKNPMIRSATILNLKAKFCDDATSCVKATHNVEAGMSGTAVFDEKGRLVGVVEGYMALWDSSIGNYSYSDYYLRIDGLEDFYRRMERIE